MKMKNKLPLLAMGIALSAQTLMAQVPSYVPTDGLVGYWPFNGNANDESTLGNNGTVNGATLTADRYGNADKAYNFDGLNDVINLPLNSGQIANSSQFTIQYWILPDATITTPQTVFANWHSVPNVPNGTPVGFLSGFYGNNSGVNVFTGYVNNFGVGSNLNINFSNWNHVIIVFDGSQPIVQDRNKVFLNGILQSNNFSCQNCSTNIPQTTGNIFNHTTVGARYIGAQNTLSDKFKGNIDDIGIWNRALTQEEINNMYNGVSYSDTCNNVSGSLTNGLVGYWPFCGNANDDSGHGNNGTVNGATLTSDRFGNANSAFSFNGTNNFIELVNSAQLDYMNNFSISTWYQVNNTSPQFQFLVSKDLMGDPPNGDWDFYINYNKVKFDITINTNNNSGTQNSLIQPNTWNHALITRNSSSGLINIYINGILENSFTGYIGPYSNTQKMNFGRQGSSNQHFLNGKLDDIGIWNRVLTPNEVTQLYNQNQCFTNTTVTETLIINVGQLSYTNPVAYANNITIYPNPTSTQVNISFNNITDLNGGNINIINSLGQQVATIPITATGTQTTMQLSVWGGTGMYFVQIINPQGQIVDIKKIILQ